MLWGRLSDTYGRKPIILLGLLISVIANLAFGFSRSIGMLLFWRVLAGMANGILGVMRTMTAEIVKERRYQARAFLALPLVFNSGRVAALVIGGCLADPVHNLPWLFGPAGAFNTNNNADGVQWTLQYPYALPSLFNGSVLAICLILAALWLRESLPGKEPIGGFWRITKISIYDFLRHRILRRPDAGFTAVKAEEGDALTKDNSLPVPPTRHHTFRTIWTRPLLKTILAFGLLPLHNATFLHIFPVFLSMPTSSPSNPSILNFTGGLGLASPTVGLFLATFGISGILLQLFIYPRIQQHLGTLGIFRLAHCIFPFAYVFAPYLALLAEQGKGIKWGAMSAVLLTQVLARTMAIPSSIILLTDAAPRGALGIVHGAGNTLSAAASAVGPVVGGMLLARGIDLGVVGMVWWCWMLVIAVATLAWSLRLEKRRNVGDGVEEVGLQ
jgi:MFS family permease